MKLEGLHHITMITADAQRNVDFYADVLGLRMVKKTVNFDQPDAYHLYFGDEQGSPGSILTWFEFAGARPGRAGDGMVHTISLGVATGAALDFWDERLAGAGHETARDARSLRFTDPDGLALELCVAADVDANPPLRAEHHGIASEHAIVGPEGARAYSVSPAAEQPLLTDTLGFEHPGEGEYVVQGHVRHFHWGYDEAEQSGIQGAGTVHHIAWASQDADHLDWQARVAAAGSVVTDVRDRDYFRSIYFQEPHGVLFEIATLSPGFATDEDPERLGERLCLPAQHEHLRERLERVLTPVVNPRAARREDAPV